MLGRPFSILAATFGIALTVIAADPVEANKSTNAVQPNVQGESFTYEENGKVLIAVDATFEANGAHLSAKKIRLNSVDGTVLAEGNVVYTTKSLRIMGEQVMLDPKADLVVAKNVKFGRNPFYFTADELRLEKGDKSMSGVRLWNNEPQKYGMSLGISEAHFSEKDNWLTFKGVTPRLMGMPFFYLPYYGQDGYRDIPYELHLDTGSRDAQGRFLRTTTLVRQTDNKSLWLGALFDYYSQSGYLFGPAIKYDNRKQSPQDNPWHGNFQTGFINDRGTLELDAFSRTPGRNRSFATGEISGVTNNGIEITGQLYATSDPNFVRNFRPREIENLGLPQATFEAITPMAGGYLSGNLVAKVDNYQDVVQKLPEVRFDLLETPSALAGFNQRSFLTATYLTQRPSESLPLANFTAATGSNAAWSTARLDAYYGLSYPITVSDYLTFKPVAGVRATDWSSGLNNHGNTSKVMAQVGFDIEGLATGSWDLKADKWGIDGMRHTVRPFIQYRTLPGANQKVGELALSDRNVALSAFREIDLADRPDPASVTSTQVARVGIRNTLATRDTESGSRELLRFDMLKDWSNNDSQLSTAASDIQTHLRLTPANWVSIDYFDRRGKNSSQSIETLQSIAFNSGDYWKTSLGLFEQNEGLYPAKQYWLQGEIRLNSVYRAFVSANYDALVHAVTSGTVGVVQRIGNSWEIEYGFYKRVSTYNDGALGLNIRVRLFKF
jgi:LPS-assembly protein